LKNDRIKKIAIANTVTAPYGTAAMTALRKSGQWDALQSKLVIAQSIAQSFQYASTESVDAGFCALSAASTPEGRKGCFFKIPEAPDIVQAGCVAKNAKNSKAAELLSIFLMSDHAAQIKKSTGTVKMDYLALYVTLKLALVTTAVLMVGAAPLAYVLAYTRFPGKSLVEALIYLPMALPPTVIGFYLIILMGPKGWIGGVWQTFTGGSLLFTFLGITIASIIYSIPFAVQPMKAAFAKLTAACWRAPIFWVCRRERRF